MAENTKIEWCDHTFNPWVGCTKVSPGCDHCYAEHLMDARMGKVTWGPGEPRVRTTASNWRMPRKWAAKTGLYDRRQRVFCASLADWLDNEVPTPWLVDLLELIRTTPQLDWLLLSKRIGNWSSRISEAIGYLDEQTPAAYPMPLRAWLAHWLDGDDVPGHVWLGATITHQAEADRDIPKLLRTPAAKRFLSMEPLLGPVELTRLVLHSGPITLHDTAPPEWQNVKSVNVVMDATRRGKQTGRPAIDWVIVGGESGPHARPMYPDWARSLRDECAGAGVPFMFKQWGEWTPGENVKRVRGTVDTAFLYDEGWHVYPLNLATDGGHIDDQPDLYRVGKKAAGRHLDGRTHDEFPA